MNRWNVRATVLAVVAIFGLIACLPHRAQAQYYWDPDLTVNGSLGGAGTWDAATANWSTTFANTTGSDVKWTSAVKDAVFAGATGTVNIVTTGLSSINTIKFISDGYVLAGGTTLTLNGSGTRALTLAGPGTTNTVAMALSVPQVYIDGGGVLLVKSNILANGNNAMTISEASTVVLTAISANKGAITLNNSSALMLSGADKQGSVSASCPNLILNSGSLLKLDNTDAANNTDRVARVSALTLNGGTLHFAYGEGNAVFFEQLGTNTVNYGASTIQTDRAGSSGTALLKVDRLARSIGATLNFFGPSLGLDARNTIVLSTGPVLDDGLLGGWATVDNEYAKYVVTPVTSVTALTSGDYSAHAEPDWVASDNVKLTGFVSLSGSRQINSLNLAQAGDTSVDIGTAQTLRVESGGLLVSGSYNAVVSGGTLTAGTGDNTAGELIIHQNSASPMTIGSTIADNGTGAVSLTKSGRGRLTLSGANTYTGPTFVNAGELLALSGALPSISNTVSVAAGTTFDLGGFTGLGSIAGGGVLTNFPALTLGYDGTAPTFSGSLATTGLVTKVGAGLQVFSGASLGTGGLAVYGSLVLSGTNTLTCSGSAHSIVIDGGTLIANGGVGATTFGTTALVANVHGILLKNNGSLVWTNSAYSGPGRTIEVAAGSTGILVTASAMASGVAAAGHVYLRGPADCRVEKYGAGTYTLGGNGEGSANFTGTFVIVQGKVDVNNNSSPQFGLGQLIVQPGAEFFGSKKNIALTNAVINGGILSFKGNDGSSGWARISDNLQGTTTLTNDARMIVARNNSANKTMSGNNVIFYGDLVVATPTVGSTIFYDDTADGLTNANSRLLVNGQRTFTVDNGPATIDFDVGVPVQTNTANGSLVKAGPGTMRFAWINPCHGNSVALGGVSLTNILSRAAVSNGTLLVDGILASTGGVTVASGGTLGGTGVLQSAVSVLQGGTLQAGDTGQQGSLTIASNLTFAAGSTCAVRLTSAGNNRIVMTGGTVNLNGAMLAVTLDFAPTVGQTFTILDHQGAGSINGAFASGGQASYGGRTYSFLTSTVGNAIVMKSLASGTLIRVY